MDRTNKREHKGRTKKKRGRCEEENDPEMEEGRRRMKMVVWVFALCVFTPVR